MLPFPKVPHAITVKVRSVAFGYFNIAQIAIKAPSAKVSRTNLKT